MPDFFSDDLKSRVSVPILPDLQKLNFYFSKSLEQKWLSNHGPCYQELKGKLADYLDAPNIELFSSGTLALLCGLKSLGLSGEVITTPFTFPATVNAIRWAGLKPVFADIVEDTLTISPDSVESLISEETCAILGVDVYDIADLRSSVAKPFTNVGAAAASSANDGHANRVIWGRMGTARQR